MQMHGRHRRYLYGGLLFVIVCSFVQIGVIYGWTHPVEKFYYDLWHQVAGKRTDASHAVIIGVDDETLLAHREEPMAFWGPHFAKALSVLRAAGARMVGIDYLFSVSAESWLSRLESEQSELSRTYDIPMREQLYAGNVVLIGMLAGTTKGKNEILLPVPDYLFSLPGGLNDIGLANLYLDDDEVVRRFLPAIFDEGTLPRETLAPMLAKRAGKQQSLFLEATAKNPQHIGFIGPPGTVPRVSFQTLLSHDALKDPKIRMLKGKVVIISAEHAGNYDTHLTPYAQRVLRQGKAMMSGAEIHANIIETLFNGQYPRPLDPWVCFLWMAAVTAAGMFVYLHYGPLSGVGFFMIFSFAAAVISYLLFLNHYILPVAGAQSALVLSYIGTIGIRLTGEEKHRIQMKAALSPYVSDEVMDEVLQSGELPDLGGQKNTVTVLFSDIRNFTSISERLESDEVVMMLNEYLGRACQPIMREGGMVNKFIGDAIMAIFGAPVGYPDHAERCMRAAQEMLEIADEFQEWMDAHFSERDLPEFNIGIGIHTGDAVIGNIGFKKRMEYTAIGDSVNVASRLEGQCKDLKCKMVVSQAAVDAANCQALIEDSCQIHVKGKGETIDVCKIGCL